MPSYKVVLNDDTKTELRITADDVEIDGMNDEDDKGNITAHDGNSFFNFYSRRSKEDPSITVAAIPFKYVLYIVS